MLGVSALVSASAVVSLLYRAGLWDDIAHGRQPSRNPNDVNDTLALFWHAYAFVQIALIVVFVIWFHAARGNIDAYPGRQGRTLSRGWAIGGWFCPVVNLWFPPMIAQEVWRASDPRAPHVGGATPGRLVLVWGWWITFVVGQTAGGLLRLLGPEGDPDTSSPTFDPIVDAEAAHAAGLARTAIFVLQIVATGFAIALVARITTFQNERGQAMQGPVFGPSTNTFTPSAPGYATADVPGPPTTNRTTTGS
ncbi:DUF4328 domain-containing protein [Embleya sp. NPDC050493]|uniref:DUF4328 domain-containing protein n=1 Tax=Embleya sp. NPDC050493 TaxID=3363989 RepID=UPI00379D18BF